MQRTLSGIMRQGLCLQHVIRMLVLALLCAGVSARVWLNLLSWISHAESKGFSLKKEAQTPTLASDCLQPMEHQCRTSLIFFCFSTRHPPQEPKEWQHHTKKTRWLRNVAAEEGALQSSSMTIINASVKHWFLKRTSLNFLCLKPPAASCQALVLQICYENWDK